MDYTAYFKEFEMKKYVFLVVLQFLLGSILFGANKIYTGTLENNMKFMVVENHSTPVVSIFMTVKVGLRDEDNLSCGVSHMLEHLLFNGTNKRTQRKLYEDTDMIGAYCNAFTRDDFTCFMMVVPSKNVEKGMDILTDMVFHSTLLPEKLKKERGIVIEELKRDMANPSFFYEKYKKENIFKGTPYRMEVLGTVDSIKKMKRDNIWKYYITHYVPSNIVALVVGDITKDKAEALLKKYSHNVRNGKVISKPIIKNIFNRKDVAVFKVLGRHSELTLTYKAPFMKDKDYFNFLLLDSYLNSPESPINKISREFNLSNVNTQYVYNRDYAIYNITFSSIKPFDKSMVEKIKKAILNLKYDSLTKDLLNNLKLSLKAEEIYNYDNIHYLGVIKGQMLADVPFSKLKNFFLNGYIKNVESVSLKGVLTAFKKYISGEKFPIITIVNGGNNEK